MSPACQRIGAQHCTAVVVRFAAHRLGQAQLRDAGATGLQHQPPQLSAPVASCASARRVVPTVHSIEKIGHCGSFINKLPCQVASSHPGVIDRKRPDQAGRAGRPLQSLQQCRNASRQLVRAGGSQPVTAKHSCRVAALEHARLRDRLLQPLAEARTARLESRPPWRSTFIHSSLGRSRKVSSGSIL